jgi:membrane-anchored mycosin MYCP
VDQKRTGRQAPARVARRSHHQKRSPGRGRSGRRWGAALAAALLAGLPALASGRPAPVAGLRLVADVVPPALPDIGNGCVGDSGASATSPSWAFSRVAPQQVWPLSTGSGVTVAVLDTGVSKRASGLTGHAVLAGTDVIGGGPADSDCFGRGTALAGIVAARPVTSSAVVGVAPATTILPVRIVDGAGQVTPDAIAAGITAAVRAHASVILVGVGTPKPNFALEAAVADAVHHDVVVVAAVSGAAASTDGSAVPAWYPASDPDVLAVGGVDQNGKPTQSATRAAGLDLLAPGVDAYSVGPEGTGDYAVGGTAVSAAYVAGAAALLRSYRPELHQAAVRQRLQATAEPPIAGVGQSDTGWGSLDAYAAVAGPATTARGAASGVRPRVPFSLPRPARPAPARAIAGAVAGGMVAVALFGYVGAVAVRRGRRRRWRP